MKGQAVYESKPKRYQAIELVWENWNEICDYLPDGSRGCYIDEHGLPTEDVTDKIGALIPNSVWGAQIMEQGDYLCKNLDGPVDCWDEWFPVKRIQFLMTFDPDKGVAVPPESKTSNSDRRQLQLFSPSLTGKGE